MARATSTPSSVAPIQRPAIGSKRITLEDLGASVSAPEVGRYAYEVGDRATLLRNAETLVEWPVRLHALQAALMEGDVPRALAIAKHYAGFYPSDEDLRTAVAAMLCIGDDPGRGLELLEQVQTGRSSLRHEGMARDFGEVRSLMMACAALAKRPLGPITTRSAPPSAIARAHGAETPKPSRLRKRF